MRQLFFCLKGVSCVLEIYLQSANIKTGHETAHALLARELRVRFGELPPLRYAPQGKPYVEGANIEFSISHTKTMAALALSDVQVGIDVETIRPIKRALALRTMTDTERAWMDTQSDWTVAFFTLWTMKESYVKLTGKGLGGRPQDIHIRWENGKAGIAGAEIHFQTRLHEGVVITLCTEQARACIWHIEE